MHLTAIELVDVAEGRRAPDSVPHLAVCDRCRGQLDELQTVIALAATVDVPEPSPLFWDHFSSRVHDAIAADEAASASGVRWWTGRRMRWLVLVPTSAVAVVALAVGLLTPTQERSQPEHRAAQVGSVAESTPQAAAAARSADLLDDAAADGDPSLTLVGDLAAAMTWDAIAEAGLASDGSADHAVTHLSTDELRALERLLRHEMGAS
jgi:hypothetical protein